jgi:hypothetical protein
LGQILHASNGYEITYKLMRWGKFEKFGREPDKELLSKALHITQKTQGLNTKL